MGLEKEGIRVLLFLLLTNVTSTLPLPHTQSQNVLEIQSKRNDRCTLTSALPPARCLGLYTGHSRCNALSSSPWTSGPLPVDSPPRSWVEGPRSSTWRPRWWTRWESCRRPSRPAPADICQDRTALCATLACISRGLAPRGVNWCIHTRFPRRVSDRTTRMLKYNKEVKRKYYVCGRSSMRQGD